MYFGSSFGKKLYLKKPKVKYRYISDHSIPGKIAERYVNKVPEVSSLIIYIIAYPYDKSVILDTGPF